MKEHSDTLRTACKDFEEDLVLYYYGDGSEKERIRVQGHLQTCSSCREFLEDLRKLLPQMAKPSELPPTFWEITTMRWSRSWRFTRNARLGGRTGLRRCGHG